jgi:hypothetical protein
MLLRDSNCAGEIFVGKVACWSCGIALENVPSVTLTALASLSWATSWETGGGGGIGPWASGRSLFTMETHPSRVTTEVTLDSGL